MYLVELGSGKDTVYSSTPELTAAIRRGELDTAVRIYHRSSCQWLPITVHPEFRRRVAVKEVPATARIRRQWTFMQDDTPGTPAAPSAPAGPPLLVSEPPAPSWREALGLRLRRIRPFRPQSPAGRSAV